MQSTRSIVIVAVLAAFSSLAGAQSAVTRAEVHEELLEATRSGNIPVVGELGRTPREITPDLYPVPTAGPARSHAEVLAEFFDARAMGELAVGDTGLTDREVHPGRYPAVTATGGKTRAEVRQELADAIRTGDILSSGDLGLTLREQFPQRYATFTRDTLARR
jgi:hypothetical protein